MEESKDNEHEPGLLHEQITDPDKIIEEDPELVKHMNECRDQLVEHNNKLELPPEMNDEFENKMKDESKKYSVEIAKCMKEISDIKCSFDILLDSATRQTNAITLMTEGGKPYGFSSKGCTKDNLVTLQKLSSDFSLDVETIAKRLEAFVNNLSKTRKTDDKIIDDLIRAISRK
jgi:hypothetical protein